LSCETGRIPRCRSYSEKEKATSFVNNKLYAGVLVWNRQRFIKDPNTGKRVSRPNPEAKWIRTEVPELRIVDDELWQRVKLRQAELAKQFEATTKGVRAVRAERLNRLRRPAFLLSGLLTCGCCGGKYGIVVNDRYGCLGHFRKGICDNSRTIRRDDIERRVLAGLTDKLVSPEAVAVAVRAYAEETNRQNHERRAQAGASRRALEKIERSIKGIMDAIEDGMYQPAMKARIGELAQQKGEIEARLAEAPADLPDVHPNIAEHYRAKVLRLAETLAEPESNGEAREDIRSLVGEVVITPGDKRGESHAILKGELMAILDLAAGRPRSPKTEVITNALACPRNHRYRRSRCESRGSVLLCNHPNRLSGSLVVRPLLAQSGHSSANIALELDGQLRSQFSLCTRNILIFGRPRPVSIRTVWRAATPCGSPRRLRRSTA
jgi:site-specific DNA recombinase